MVKTRPKAPKASREELRRKIDDLLRDKKKGECVEILTAYYTNVDLEMIVTDLERGVRNDIAV
ncbi:hypothetical protein PQB35_gp19 [Ochrobactrum phage vB_OspP_OH]|uniref:Uncharacterized protein n=1 Tax=Ochrobactrum phage vB_OspP_OH TaxID=2712957 RepID=A0A6G6XYH5_9CAUD|nr:hypothetical protein PQB35_gp19 [Ochrobactrum phage vB_OspP_OH]QIG66075.1 hypothetical protein phiOH_p19 [Ochrobactrum phage vB_OspP_OH]